MSRYWKDYRWSNHALDKISQYNWHLRYVFGLFEEAKEVEKDDDDWFREYLFHGKESGTKAKTYIKNRTAFVVGTKKTVVTVYKLDKTHLPWVRKIINGEAKFIEKYK